MTPHDRLLTRRSALAALFGSAAAAGCAHDGHVGIFGYTTAPNYDPEIRTVFVPVFRTKVFSTTPYRNMEMTLTRKVIDAIESTVRANDRAEGYVRVIVTRGPGTIGPDPRKNPAAKDVVAEFKAKNFDPEAYTLYSYAAVQIFKQAAEKAKSLDPKKVSEAMHSGMTFNTVIGPISYDKKGDRTTVDYVWYVWKKAPDGKITYEQIGS